jgi:nucleoside-diphosphate-sugar epimerase
MKILITGASGRLGGYVIRELAGEYELVLMSRGKPAAEFADIPWIGGDLNNFADCQRAVAGVQVIQHLGAQPWPVDHPHMREQAEAQSLPFDATFKTNMLGTYYLMQAAAAAGVNTVVMAGSNCALGHGFRISQTPFPLQALPIDENHPCYPEDSYSYSKLAGEELLASFSRAYGIRTYITRISGIRPPERRQQMAENVKPATGWDPWLWCWVGSEDVARAHRLLMEAAVDLPPHDIFYLNADDTTALEPSPELIARFKPDLAPLAEGMTGHQSFFSNAKLKKAVGWQHRTSWRAFLEK